MHAQSRGDVNEPFSRLERRVIKFNHHHVPVPPAKAAITKLNTDRPNRHFLFSLEDKTNIQSQALSFTAVSHQQQLLVLVNSDRIHISS